MKRQPMSLQRWNRVAHKFEKEVCDITASHQGDQMERLVKSIRLPRSKQVLVDLGCGRGTFIRKYGDRFDEIIGADFAARILARAKTNCRGVKNVKWLALSLPRAAKVIGQRGDLVVCMNVITSTSKARRDAMFAGVAAVTRHTALIVVPSFESAEMVRKLTKPNRRGNDGDGDGVLKRDDAIQKHFTRDELAAIVTQKGLTPKRIVPIYYPWSDEGLSKPRASGSRMPWDWACVARRVEVKKRGKRAAG